MPGLYTHYTFGREVYKQLENHLVKNAIREHRTVYNLGMQGPDIFFYFPGFPLLNRLGRKISNLGTRMHHSPVNPFFMEMLKETCRLKGRQQQVAIAYLAGFCGHLSLDSTAHPMIYHFTEYKEGVKGNFEIHATYETDIDYCIAQKYLKKSPYNIKTKKEMSMTKYESEVVGDLLCKVCAKCYDMNQWKSMYRFAVRNFPVMTSLFQSKTGKRKRILQRIEKLVLGHYQFSPLVVEKKYKMNSRVLNESHHRWENYWNKELVSCKSFLDLFDEARQVYCCMIDAMNEYIMQKKYSVHDGSMRNKYVKHKGSMQSKKKQIKMNRAMDEFLRRVGNRSYRSGLSYDEFYTG